MAQSSSFSIQAVLFDLDGTLLDTAPDMVNALNQLLVEEGQTIMSLDECRSTVSHGSRALVELAFGKHQSSTDRVRRSRRFLDIYAESLCVDTKLFLGMETVLNYIEEIGLSWGVVTNKPGFLTNPLMEALELSERACSIVSGDTLGVSKPDPAPLYHAANQCHCLATECFYVGDAQRDMEAGRRAGMSTLLASYGYINPAERPETWQVDGIITHPEEILEWLGVTRQDQLSH